MTKMSSAVNSTYRRTAAILGMALLLLTACPPSYADQSAPAPPPMKGVEWTTIQDLKPNAAPENRTVKQKWAVVVGASKFKEKRLCGEEIAMDAAAQAFYRYLIDPHGGRFDPEHVKLLINGAATRQNIMNALNDRWLGSLSGKDDLVVVFVATNGFPTTDGTTYLCAYDAALDNIYSTCISMQTLMDTLRHNVRSDRILLVLQACYSGAADSHREQRLCSAVTTLMSTKSYWAKAMSFSRRAVPMK